MYSVSTHRERLNKTPSMACKLVVLLNLDETISSEVGVWGHWVSAERSHTPAGDLCIRHTQVSTCTSSLFRANFGIFRAETIPFFLKSFHWCNSVKAVML